MDFNSNTASITFVFVVSMVTLGHGIGTTFDYCSVSEVEYGKKQCIDTYGDIGQGNDETFCENVECFIQCLTDAVGDCSKRDKFYKDDVNVIKVLYRAKCDNPELTRRAQRYCQVETPCTGKNFTADQLVNGNKISYNTSNDALTKRLQCMLNEAELSCTTVPITNQCKSGMAQHLGGLAIVEKSLRACGSRQGHYMFDVYKDRIQCNNPKVDSHCFTPALMSRMSKCTPVSLFHILDTKKNGRESICENVECISQCYESAIGDCYKKNQYVMIDPVTMRVSTRATCDRYTEVKSAMKNCRMIDIKCFQDLEADLTGAYLELILQQKYDSYKTSACRSSAIFRACIKYQYSSECSEQDASLLQSIFQSWHSYTQCDPRDDDIYNKYKGGTKCGGSSGLHVLNNVYVIYLYMSLMIVLNLYM